MKENNNNIFPNIKPVKLKEEINNNNNNLKQKQSNKIKLNGSIYCLLYLLFLSCISYLFILNYLKTKDAFKDNKYINLSPEILCDKAMKELTDCLKVSDMIRCQYFNTNLELCYDETFLLNQICFVFISELELCLRKNNNNSNKCNDYINAIIRCGNAYKHINLKKDYLKEINKL